jgi:hypothetical protein
MQAAYVPARVTALPWRAPPSQVPQAFSVSSRVIGSILYRYVQTQGSITRTACQTFLGQHICQVGTIDHSDFFKFGPVFKVLRFAPGEFWEGKTFHDCQGYGGGNDFRPGEGVIPQGFSSADGVQVVGYYIKLVKL